MPFNYVDQHLQAFQTMAQLGKWDAKSPSAWIASIGQNPLSPDFSQEPLTRESLKAACRDKTVSDRDLLWGILAWGKMHRLAARRFAKNEQRWINVVNQLRTGLLNRAESYKLCHDTVADLPSGGIGPAYYTKIIFFANPRHDGYIMDQWTSRSVNLLVGTPLIKIHNKNYVSKSNSEAIFDEYCLIVENLSEQLLGKDPEETEQCLFSTGGRNPASWRKYVKFHT